MECKDRRLEAEGGSREGWRPLFAVLCAWVCLLARRLGAIVPGLPQLGGGWLAQLGGGLAGHSSGAAWLGTARGLLGWV